MATVRKARWPAVAVVVAAWFGASMSGGVPPLRAEDPPAPPMSEPSPVPTERPARRTAVEDGAGPSAATRGDVDLLLGDGLKVEEVLRVVALTTRQSIVWTDTDNAMHRQLKGTSRIVVRWDELFSVVRDLLATHEVALIPLGPPDRPVWFASDARTLSNHFFLRPYAEPVVLDDERARDLEHHAGRFVSAVIPAPLDDLREARTALQRLVTGNNVGSVTELPSARAFLVTDFAPQAVAVYRAIQAMRPRGGSPGPDEARIDVYAFETPEARDAGLATLRELFVERVAVPTPVPPAAPAAASARGPRFSALAAEPRLIAKGTAAELELVRVAATACGARLDVAASSPR
ncbi:MAG: hypothetical protein JNM10_16630 [Planctomycetia bacterium]|nr:hypothetical protein [Planctomycetia bacterium]